MDSKKIWAAVLESFRLVVSPGIFTTYFKNTELLNMSESGERFVCEVGVGNASIRETLDRRYYGQIIAELERLSSKKCEVVFKIVVKESTSKDNLPLFEERNIINSEVFKRTGLRPDFTFDNYAVSGSNQMAFAAPTTHCLSMEVLVLVKLISCRESATL